MEANAQLATREALISRAKRRYTHVDLPDGTRARLRNLTEREKSQFEADLLTDRGSLRKNRLEDAKRRLIVQTVVDAAGDLVLQPGDVKLLEEQDGALTSALYDAARKHCGFDVDDLEGLVKNSAGIHADGSP